MEQIATQGTEHVEVEIEEQVKPPRLKQLAGVLRQAGAVVLLASAAAFLLQGWSDDTSMLRYYAFLAFTVGLSAVGFFCGIRLREDKGARTCLAVAAAMVPAHFLALGGLVYSRTHADVSTIPVVVRWVAATDLQAGLAIAAATLFLAPLCLIAFTSLARAGARVAAPLFMLLCAGLLIPTRDPSLVSLIACGLFLVPLLNEVKGFAANSGMQTREGALVRGLLFAPLAGVLVRNLLLHGGNDIFAGTFAAIIALALFVLGPALAKSDGRTDYLQALATPPAGAAVLLLGTSALTSVGCPSDLVGVLSMLLISVTLIGMSLFCRSSGAGYRSSAATIAIGSVLFQLAVAPGMTASLLCLATALVILAYGYTIEQRWVFLSGVIGTGVGMLYHIRSAMELFSMSPWVSLATIGVITVVSASYLERNYREVLARSVAFKKRVSTWN